MITENNKRLEFENLQDAMETAKNLMKNGYQVYMNIEDDLGDGKIIVVIEYEYVDDDLADGRYIYKSYADEVSEEEENRQKKDKETADDGKEEIDKSNGEMYDKGYRHGWSSGYEIGYNVAYDEITHHEDNDDVDGNYSNWSEEHRRWFDAGYDEGYETAKYDFCDCPEED